MTTRTDWEAIEREFRAGQLSTREIARQHDLSEAAIRKKAKAEGWERDLSDKVRQQARAKLVRDAGAQEGTQDGAHSQRANEVQAVEAAAQRQVEIVRQHRQAIGRGRDLTLRLLDELSATTTHVGELEEMIEAETADDSNTKRRTAMLKAVSLPSRAVAIKDLSAAAKNWITLERQAFSIDDEKEPEGKVDPADIDATRRAKAILALLNKAEAK